jgi:hypothetical protein
MLAAAEIEFDGQNVQREGPNSDLYVSTKHDEQILPFSPVYPELHVHDVCRKLPAAEMEFDKQATQIPDPNPIL